MTVEEAPHFPTLPDGYWRNAAAREAVVRFIGDVHRWRGETLRWLRGGDRTGDVSSELVSFLRWTLADAEASAQDPDPYEVSTFPMETLHQPGSTAQDTSAGTDALDILVWRARVVDMLADVWDTFGPARFEVDECRHATRLFMPDESGGARYCPYCLEPESDASDHAAHDATCPIQRNVLDTSWDESGEE